MMHAVSWTYFEEHDRRSKSFATLQAILSELTTVASTLDTAHFHLKILGEGLPGKPAERTP